MSPERAILLHSPGRKPWVKHWNTFIEKGAALPRRKTNARVVSAAPTELDITFRSCIPRVSFQALPSFHPGLCRSIVPTALIMHLNFDALALLLSKAIICLLEGLQISKSMK